jgi:hypothetical protein
MLVDVTERARPKLREMLKEKSEESGLSTAASSTRGPGFGSAFRVVFKGFG